MIQINQTRIMLNENNRIAHSYFQIGLFAKWTDSKETKQLKKLEQDALDYTFERMYESEMVII